MEKSSRRNRNESSGSGLKNDIHDESEVPVLQRASKKRRHSFREELEEGKDGGRLPLAPRLEVFGKDPKSYRPRNEWFRLTNDEPITTTVRDALFHTTRNRTAAMVSTVTTTATGTPTSLPLFPKVSFGDDRDSAVHYCIRSDYFDAARKLISEGPCRLIHVENLKGMTPIILAAQSGNLAMVQYLHELGANTSHVSVNGSTTALQAAHFGHLHVLKFILGINSGLLEQSNQHKTTPLMRASQENHLSVVKFLCELGAGVNGKNLQGMTALMLASQRGNAEVCRYLIQHGADVDAMTERSSTSLIFACKGEHLQTVQVLVCGGAELFIKDGRGRTPREICLHRISHPTQPTSNPETIQKIVSLLDPLVQVDLMRCQARSERSFSWIRLWTLLQEDRARLRGVEDRQFHDAVEIAGERDLFSPTDMAWFRMLCLPAPLVRHIAEFCPLPNHFGRRLSLLFKRCSHDANSALVACFDIIDEVLEERGFLQALDQALIPPPAAYSSWVTWRQDLIRKSPVITSINDLPSLCGPSVQPLPNHHHQIRPNATTATLRVPDDTSSLVEHRRYMGYLNVLSKYRERLEPLLTSSPWDLSSELVERLVLSSDLCSVIRRVGWHHLCGSFSLNVAMDLVLFTSCLWSSDKRMDDRLWNVR